MEWIPAYRMRTGLLCAFLVSVQIDPVKNDIIDEMRLQCDHNPSGDATLETCRGCKHFCNLQSLYNGPEHPGMNTDLDSARDLLKRTSKRVKAIQDEAQLELTEPSDRDDGR
jgi:hypothetical protein